MRARGIRPGTSPWPRVSAAAVDTAVLDAQLPGWDYADAYEVMVDGDGPATALAAIGCLSGPGPASVVLRARDLLVSVVGLKPAATGAVELFPVVVDTPQFAVVGLDDSHLDFRILVSLGNRRVRCVTAVRRHNQLGGAYFAVVRPFHRRLVPLLLTGAAQRRWTEKVDSGKDEKHTCTGRRQATRLIWARALGSPVLEPPPPPTAVESLHQWPASRSVASTGISG